MTRIGVDRVLKFAFELAQQEPRKKHLTSATKSNGISITMPYWDERVEEMAKAYPDVALGQVPHRHPHRAFRAESRTGSTWSSPRTCSATSCPISVRPAPAPSALPPRATSTRSATSRRCSSRSTARRPTLPGKGIANPIGQIWSGAMMLDHLGEARSSRSHRQAHRGCPGRTHAADPGSRRQCRHRGGRQSRGRGCRLTLAQAQGAPQDRRCIHRTSVAGGGSMYPERLQMARCGSRLNVSSRRQDRTFMSLSGPLSFTQCRS